MRSQPKPIFIYLAMITMFIIVYLLHATAAQSLNISEWSEINRLVFIYISFTALSYVYNLPTAKE